MQGTTHLIVGAAAGLAVATATTSPAAVTVATMATSTALGGLFGLIPDWLQINIPGASKQIKGTFGHRGFSHWLWTALAAAYAANLVWQTAAMPILAGWISHLLLDALSSGVPAFWPFGRITLARIKTGSHTDHLIGATGLIVLAAQIIWRIR